MIVWSFLNQSAKNHNYLKDLCGLLKQMLCWWDLLLPAVLSVDVLIGIISFCSDHRINYCSEYSLYFCTQLFCLSCSPLSQSFLLSLHHFLYFIFLCFPLCRSFFFFPFLSFHFLSSSLFLTIYFLSLFVCHSPVFVLIVKSFPSYLSILFFPLPLLSFPPFLLSSSWQPRNSDRKSKKIGSEM